MKNRVGIIADDLTGANDSGVQLAKKNLSAAVIFNIEYASIKEKPDVLIIDTDSRSKSAEEAYDAAHQAAKLLKDIGYQHIYKKIDSTLRGNIVTELLAVHDVFKPEAVVIVPAFPKMNRKTVNGHHYVNGKLITDTEFARDPKTPVREAYLPEFFKGSDKNAVLLDSEFFSLPNDEIAEKILSRMDDGDSWFVCDSASEEDLKRVASIFMELNKQTLWCGSAGLIEYLPDYIEFTPEAVIFEETSEIDHTLVVSGSLSDVTKKQLERISDSQNVCFIEADPAELVADSYDLNQYTLELKQHADCSCFVLYVDSSEINRRRAKETGDALGLTTTEISVAISKGLGKIAGELLKADQSIKAMVLTGGDTAKAVCMELGVTKMDLYAEVEPGLPFGKISTDQHSYWTVTKAGGFGHEQSLVNAVNYMANMGWVRL
ncbi:four-carbon acid sugar kinase family protein [Metabacillus sp. SLBN-84]